MVLVKEVDQIKKSPWIRHLPYSGRDYYQGRYERLVILYVFEQEMSNNGTAA